MPHHQTPNTAVPTKTHAESPKTHQSVTSQMVARGLTGVRVVTSDAHTGLVEAIAANLPGATCQRCRTHYAANLMTVVPKSLWPAVKAMLHWRLRPARRSSRRGSVRPPSGLRPHDPARGCRPPRGRTSRPAGLPPPSLSRYEDRSGLTTPNNASIETSVAAPLNWNLPQQGRHYPPGCAVLAEQTEGRCYLSLDVLNRIQNLPNTPSLTS